MTSRQACTLLIVALAPVLLTWAQSQAPGSISGRRPASPAGKGAAKAVKPDPDLLDGSIYEAEKRPLYGMISDVELPGSEQKSERVGGQPQPAGTQSPQTSASMPKMPSGGSSSPPQQSPQAATPPPIQSGQDDRQPPEGSQGQAAGVQAQKLEGQGGAPDPNDQSKPKDMQIGDATLQIQTLPQNQQQQVVGTETTSTQQYEKKVPAGQQTDNRNRGVEKGKVMPKGI